MDLFNSAIVLIPIALIWTGVVYLIFKKMIGQQTKKDKEMLLGGLLIFVALAAIIVVGTAVFETVESPEFCGTFCHVMEPYYESYISPSNNIMMSAHTNEDITCSNCHNEPGIIGTIQGLTSAIPEMYIYITNTYDINDLHGHVSREACLKCHDYGVKNAKEPKQINSIGGLVVNPHEDDIKCSECHDFHTKGIGLTESACSVCHGSSIENFQDMIEKHGIRAGENCMDCHDRDHPKNAKISFAEFPSLINTEFCSDCHNDDVERLNKRPHKMKVCTDCHNEHQELRIDFSDCGGCHNPPSNHDTSTTSCSLCHDGVTYIHLKSSTVSEDLFSDLECSNCHYTESSAYEASFDSAALEIYGDEGCISCHSDHETKNVPHQKTAPYNDCDSCHKNYDSDSSVHDRTDIKYLGFSGITNQFCSDCHKDETNRFNNGIHYGRECTDCHGEHEIRVDFKNCDSCHKETPDWHDTSTSDCSNCHIKLTKIHSESDGDSGGTTSPDDNCLSCHNNGIGPSIPQELISTLGTIVNPHTGIKECNVCHKASNHQSGDVFDGLTQDACVICHGTTIEDFEDMLSDHSDRVGAECMNCHNRDHPSDARIPFSEYPSIINLDFCSDCHAEKVTRLQNEDHNYFTDCTICHGEHNSIKIEFDKCILCHGDNLPSNHDTSLIGCTSCHTDVSMIH